MNRRLYEVKARFRELADRSGQVSLSQCGVSEWRSHHLALHARPAERRVDGGNQASEGAARLEYIRRSDGYSSRNGCGRQ